MKLVYTQVLLSYICSRCNGSTPY